MSGRGSPDPAVPATSSPRPSPHATPDPTHPSTNSTEVSRRAAWVAVALVGGLAVVLLVVSTSGPVRVLSEPPPGPVETAVLEVVEETGEVADEGTGIAPVAEPGDGWFLRLVALAVGVLLLRLAWMTIAGWWAILRTWRPGNRRRVRPAAFEALPTVGAPPEVVLDEAAQVEALRTGAPRNAIVACWMRLEDDVAAAGLAPRPSETSAELTARVLDAALTDRAAVEELAERYREARFSTHPIGERERELALAALARIHASLRRRSAVGTRDTPGIAPGEAP